MKNRKLLNSLPSATYGDRIFAYLIPYDQGLQPGVEPAAQSTGSTDSTESTAPITTPQNRVWNFLINPSVLSYSRSAVYSDTQTWAAKKQDIQYFTTNGQTLKMPNIILDSWHDGRSLRPLIEGINALLEAQIDQNRYYPPVLSFVWGSTRFAPCVLTEVTWDEAAWLSGEPATVVLNLTFREVPEPRSRGTAAADTQLAPNEEASEQGSPRLPLTDAQASQASTYANQFLDQNLNNWSPEIQAQVRSDSYRLLTNRATGDVQMLNPDGTVIGTVLRWNGEAGTNLEIRSGATTTIPARDGYTLPETLDPDALAGTATPAM